MIIMVGGIKGGSGKSTSATNLAVERSTHKEVLLIDADDQETAADFTVLRNETTKGRAAYTCIKLTGNSIRTEVKKLQEKYDDIIIDIGGRDTISQRAALCISDILLVPFLPRSFDVWTLEKISQLVEEAKTVNENLKAYIYLNRADPQGLDNLEAESYLKDSPTFTFLNAPLGNRKVFSNAQAKGLGVSEFYPLNHKAKKEITILYEYVFNINSMPINVNPTLKENSSGGNRNDYSREAPIKNRA